MKTFVKCELCNTEISGDRCVFAVHKRIIDGEEHCFCCKHHADEFERRHGEEQ